MTQRLLLVRHPPVCRRWSGRCYGASDMGWSRVGQAMARALVERLAAEAPEVVIHSDLIRTRRLAERLAGRLGLLPRADPRWRERHFGAWEGRGWQAIWRETGTLMDRLMTDPATFRPGGDGETGAELRDRVLAAAADLPRDGTIVIVAHGGPIATLRATLAGAPLEEAARFIPACGEIVTLA